MMDIIWARLPWDVGGSTERVAYIPRIGNKNYPGKCCCVCGKTTKLIETESPDRKVEYYCDICIDK